MSEPWDEERFYDEKIHPLLQQISDLCTKHKIPMLAVFQYADDGKGRTSFVTSHVDVGGQSDHMDQLNALARTVADDREPVVLAMRRPRRARGSRRIH